MASQAAGTASGFTLSTTRPAATGQFARPLTDTASPPVAAAAPSAPATAGTWTFLAGTYDANTGAMTLYVNGTAAGTATDPTPIAAHGPLHHRQRQVAGRPQGDWLDGQAHNVQVYPRALSAAEVASCTDRPAATSPRAR